VNQVRWLWIYLLFENFLKEQQTVAKSNKNYIDFNLEQDLIYSTFNHNIETLQSESIT